MPAIERTSTASSASIASAGVGSARAWHLRIIHWRRWSPFGSDPGTRIDRHKAEDLQRLLGAEPPEQVDSKLRWLQPSDRNHAESAEALAPKGYEAKDTADQSNMDNPIEIESTRVRSACETSPDRRHAVKALHRKTYRHRP